MDKKKWRVLCFVNQFFGQIGGEEMASVGFSVVDGTVGPTILIDSLLGEDAEVVATIICGDNYFVNNIDMALEEGLALVEKFNPDLFFAGPTFNAGRYGISAGNMASFVAKKFSIPTITAMYEENPAVELFRKDTYILKTAIHASSMKPTLEKMVNLGFRFLKNEDVLGADTEGYIKGDVILNEMQEKNAAERAIDMVLKKIKGEHFVSEILPPIFDEVVPAPPLENIDKSKIAIITDGGLIPENNPDKLKPNGSLNCGVYDFESLINNKHYVIHSGYDGTWVLKNPYRLLPYDVLFDFVKEKKIGSLDSNIYVVCGNCASISASKEKGKKIAERLLEEGVKAAILTST